MIAQHLHRQGAIQNQILGHPNGLFPDEESKNSENADVRGVAEEVGFVENE